MGLTASLLLLVTLPGVPHGTPAERAPRLVVVAGSIGATVTGATASSASYSVAPAASPPRLHLAPLRLVRSPMGAPSAGPSGTAAEVALGAGRGAPPPPAAAPRPPAPERVRLLRLAPLTPWRPG